METTFCPALLSGTMTAPGSKSEAHRRLICAGLSEGTTRISNYADSRDLRATLACLCGMGADGVLTGDTMTVRGISGSPVRFPVLDCGESGSTLRFFVPLAMALTGGGVFLMHGKLGRRPMDVYRDLFVPRGIDWYMTSGADGGAELHVRGWMEGGTYALPGNVSSQFISGLLFALPLLQKDSVLKVVPPVESSGYIRMTAEIIRQSGIVLEEVEPFVWKIPGGQHYRTADSVLTGDYSHAAVFLCADAIGHDVTVQGLDPDALQGDKAVLKYLTDMGASVETTPDGGIRVTRTTSCAVMDMSDCPDIIAMLALVCSLTPGESRLKNCGRLKLKETDRFAAVISILKSLGVKVRAERNDIVIRGSEKLAGLERIDCSDNRMVMLLSVAAASSETGFTVNGTESLSKSWPEFLSVYQSVGGIIR